MSSWVSQGTRRAVVLPLLAMMLLAQIGCSGRALPKAAKSQLNYYTASAMHIETPDVSVPASPQSMATGQPLSLGSDGEPVYWDMTLDEALQLALSNSKVLRDIGGRVLDLPESVATIHDPALQWTDPRFGVPAALSAFDAEFSTNVFFEKNDRVLNNSFEEGIRLFQQDLMVMQSQIRKRTAVGTDVILRHNTDYDANNSPANLFPSAWNTNFEAEIRQPLLQGYGAQFNRIAGPDAQPGQLRGVLLGRINADVGLADFEKGVRDLVSDVSESYWDLYFAYHDLEAQKIARDAALDTWRQVHALYVAGRAGGEAWKEALAREQYFRRQEAVQATLSGRTDERQQGIYAAERRLRLLIGIPINDGRLIRPLEEPLRARVVFDWSETAAEAVVRRVELRRQRWLVKQRELELVGNKHFLLPQLDAVALCRWRGFGDDLLDPDDDGKGRFDNAYGNLTSGDFQEWRLGAELVIPIGFRRAHTAVRHSQLQLAREKAVLQEQERDVMHGLSNAVAEVDTTYEVAQTAFNRRIAARQHRDAAEAAYVTNEIPLEQVLDAQRRQAEAESDYYRSLVNYTKSVYDVHFQKGSFLEYNQIFLSESGWPHKAYQDAAKRLSNSVGPLPINYAFQGAPKVSAGPYSQKAGPGPGMLGAAAPGEMVPPPAGMSPEVLPPPGQPQMAPIESPGDPPLTPPNPGPEARSILQPNDRAVGKAPQAAPIRAENASLEQAEESSWGSEEETDKTTDVSHRQPSPSIFSILRKSAQLRALRRNVEPTPAETRGVELAEQKPAPEPTLANRPPQPGVNLAKHEEPSVAEKQPKLLTDRPEPMGTRPAPPAVRPQLSPPPAVVHRDFEPAPAPKPAEPPMRVAPPQIARNEPGLRQPLPAPVALAQPPLNPRRVDLASERPQGTPQRVNIGPPSVPPQAFERLPQTEIAQAQPVAPSRPMPGPMHPMPARPQPTFPRPAAVANASGPVPPVARPQTRPVLRMEVGPQVQVAEPKPMLRVLTPEPEVAKQKPTQRFDEIDISLETTAQEMGHYVPSAEEAVPVSLTQPLGSIDEKSPLPMGVVPGRLPTQQAPARLGTPTREAPLPQPPSALRPREANSPMGEPPLPTSFQ